MPEIRVAWEWKSTSPLHVGSGLSQPGVADNLVQRDCDGNPIIPGEAVKGALRMAAEQVAAWLGAPQDYDAAGNAEPRSWPTEPEPAAGNAEPRSWPLARLFGGAGAARCTPATLAELESQGNGPGSDRPPTPHKRPHVFTSTAIDRATGTAKDDTLRKTEFVPGGLGFKAQYTAGVADGETEAVETLLLAALAAVESVGGKAGIGWGRVDLADVTVEVDGKARVPTAAVTPERLRQLRSALSSKPPSPDGATARDAAVEPARRTASESPETASELQWFKLTIELQEPTCLPDLPEFSNQVTTQDCIPATTLRGALASYWRRSGCDEVDVRSWLSDETAWTPALRTIDGTPTVPASRSFVTTKRAHGSEPPVHDTFRPRWPTTKAGDSLQWRALAGASIRWDGSKTLVAERAVRQTRMHVARDYRTGSKRTGALYARESLAPGTRFVAWARVPPAAFAGSARPAPLEAGVDTETRVERLELLIGKRLSAGNGRACVGVERLHEPIGPQLFTASNPDGQADSCSVFVQLISPAVVYDPDGYPRRTLNGEWWASEFSGEDAGEIKILLQASRTAPGRRGGWMGAWRHARAAVTTIDAGSVWHLCCRTPENAASLRTRLRERGRIGERTHEGFGWIVVDPPWLGKEGANELDLVKPEPPEPEGEATPWPGTNISACELANIARGLPTTEVSEPEARAYQEIAARVVRIDPEKTDEAGTQLQALKTLCEKRAERRSKWKPAQELLSRSEYRGAAEGDSRPAHYYRALQQRLLFELGILVTRGTPPRR